MSDATADASRVLAALARGVLGAGYTSEVPIRMVETLSRLPGEAERRQVLAVFRALGTKPGAFALTGKRVPVSWLSPAGAEALVMKWKQSRLPLQRRLAQVVISLAL